VLLREVLRQALQPLGEPARLGRRDLPVHQRQQLAFAVEAAGEVVGHRALAEIAHQRAVGLPAQRLVDLQPIAVVRPQLEHLEPVERGQRGHDLSGLHPVVVDDLLEGPLAERAQRDGEQPRIGHQHTLLRGLEHQARRAPVADLAGQVGEVDPQHRENLVDAAERHVSLGQDALDARLGQAELAGELRVGEAGAAQLGLQCGDEIARAAHGESRQRSIELRYQMANISCPDRFWLIPSGTAARIRRTPTRPGSPT